MTDKLLTGISSAVHDIAYGIVRKKAPFSEPSLGESLGAIARSLQGIEKQLETHNMLLTRLVNKVGPR